MIVDNPTEEGQQVAVTGSATLCACSFYNNNKGTCIQLSITFMSPRTQSTDEASKHSCKPMSINVLLYINLTINTGSGDENTSLHEYYSQSSLPALTIQVTIPSPLCAVQIH